ncbi:MAG: EAL domain-containing protein [Azonexus sp.]
MPPDSTSTALTAPDKVVNKVPFLRSLRARLLLAALAIEILVLGVMLGSGLKHMENQLGRQLGQHVQALQLAYQTAITVPLVARDYATLRDILDGWRQADELHYIVVTSPDGKILANSGFPSDMALPQADQDVVWGEVMHQVFPVDFQGQRYGSVHLGLDTGFIAAAGRQLIWRGLLVAGIGIVLTIILLLVTGLWLTRHLRTLTQAAARIAAGDYAVHVTVPTRDEIALLAKSFNTMASAVENRVDELARQAGHDSLTGLHNRRAFEAHLEEALRIRLNQSLYVLYLDLDQFKAVNDSCGHAAGDLLLQSLGQVMSERFGADFIARLGGDEFGLVIVNATPDSVHLRAQMMIDEIRAFPFVWEGRAFQLGASIGLVQVSPHIDTVTSLLIAADTACYAAKEHGRNRVEVYAPGDDYFRQRQDELASLAGITAALQDDRFVLYHQRITSLKPGRPDHAEVLIRMRDEAGKIILPGRFIPAAERYNLMPFIDRWVINAALARLQEFAHNGGLPFHHVNINLSGAGLAEEGMRHFIAERIAFYGTDPAQICFEITESQAIGNLGGALALIADAHHMGSTIALDDFGSGLSSFGYLKRFNVDYLKIDGQFIRNLAHDPIDRATVVAIIGLAKAHGLRTVAEFVAEPEIVDIVRELGVDYAQGFALHEPSPF